MDVLSQFWVQIDAKNKNAKPGVRQEMCAALVLGENYKIPAGKSRVFFLKNTLPGLTLFEPSDQLPEGLLGIPTLSQGEKVAIQLDNLSEKDVLLNSNWDIGKLYTVEVTKAPKTGHLPEVPTSLTETQRRELQQLLGKYKDVFYKEG